MSSKRRGKENDALPPSKRFSRKTYLPDTSYHLFTRRPQGLPLFHDDQDYTEFESILRRLLAPRSSRDRWGNLIEPVRGIRTLAYCLMETHFHLIAHQSNNPRAIAELMQRAKLTYSLYYRRRYDHTGPLYEDRYQAVTVATPDQLVRLIAYVHANPIEQSFNYRWSSHKLFMGSNAERAEHWCDAEAGLRAFHDRGHYLERLHVAIEEKKRRRDAKAEPGPNDDDA